MNHKGATVKDLHAESQAQSYSLQRQAQFRFVIKRWVTGWRIQTMLIGLMVPLLMAVVNMTMFGVAVPSIRDDFALQVDTASWLVIAYTLPFMMFMPLYGRLSDGLGKRRLFLLGIATFWGGTVILLLAINLGFVILGRAVQGIGAAGINPLCMAIISERFPVGERGKVLGTWNSIGPIAGIFGPLMGGFLIDHLGWHTIFWPVLFFGLIALFAVRKQVPAMDRRFVQPGFLRTFDWGGAILLGVTTVMLVFYISSRSITGLPPLRDWRLLVTTLLFFGAFLVWEKYHPNPFVVLDIFTDLSFSRASLSSAIRMYLMGSIMFLLPLYLTDIHALTAAAIGTVVMLHAGALLVTMRIGGQLADQWTSRRPVIMGSSIQLVTIIYFAYLPETTSLWLVVAGLIGHGLGAGLSLAALHRSALNKIPPAQMGMAAGLYSMIRMGGLVLGGALGGIVLQYGLDRSVLAIEAYRQVFWFVAGVASLGVVIGWGLRE
jgi:EmrB/QacA subfamily drug resistance transporter